MDVGNDFENEKLSDWLAKNKNQLININPNNFYFTQYYYHLQEYFNSKIQSKPIIQNIIYNVENPINAKKESFNKIKPSHLKDILINDMTEVKFRKTIDENFEIRKGKYFTKGKKQFEVRNNLFKYFFELLEKGNFVQAAYVTKVDWDKIMGDFFNISIDFTEYSRDSAPSEQNNYVINYILDLKLS